MLEHEHFSMHSKLSKIGLYYPANDAIGSNNNLYSPTLLLEIDLCLFANIALDLTYIFYDNYHVESKVL